MSTSVSPSRLTEQLVAAALAVVVSGALASVPVVRPSVLPATPLGVGAPVATLVPEAPSLGLFEPAPVGEVVSPAPGVVPVLAPDSTGPARTPAPPPRPLLHDPVQARVEQALGSLGYPWQELGYDIRFVPYTGGLLGLADPATSTITVFVKPGQSVQALRVVLAHEIAHALDDRTGSPEQRSRYLELRGLPPDTAWFPCNGCDDFDSPAGDFAEVFAAWLVGASDFRSRVAPLPDDGQLQQLQPLFAPPSAWAPMRSSAAAPARPRPPRPTASPSPGLFDALPG